MNYPEISNPTSATFVATFRDGVTTRMTVHCPEGLDLRRGIALARAAYQTRMKGKLPPPIVEARFQTKDGDVLVTIKNCDLIEDADEPVKVAHE